MKTLVNISRLLVGLLFIVSGLIKANDPLGFSYKLEEYFEVFGMMWMNTFALSLAMFISIIEIVLGVALLMGVWVTPVAWLLLLMILFFTGLTGYSAVTGKVTDCGCFGDALKLTPVQSFYKDLVLLALILIIFIGRKHILPFISRQAGVITTITGLILASAFTWWCYSHLPVIDFRPYAIGKNIIQQMEIPEGTPRDEYQTLLFYEKDGQLQEFTMQNYPWQDSTWVWKETKSVLVKKGFTPAIANFVIQDSDGIDRTEDILNNPGFQFLLIAYDLNKTNLSVQPKINEFVQKIEPYQIPFTGITATNSVVTDQFRHEVQASYPYYFADATMLKTIVRSNPGLVLLDGATVVAMWHYNDFPTFEEFARKYNL